jgi:hypothetical protein
MNLNIYKPSVFQGNLKKKNYFEGWYFKNISADLNHVYSFIPGISLNDQDSHAFIQILNGVSGESEYISYPVSEFSWHKNKLYIKIGNSVFTDNYLSLDIRNGKTRISGQITFHNIVKYPSSLISPGIMGWYSFVPFMECKHGIVSANHKLSGSLNMNTHKINFDYGKGYIEKDWGTSFPEAWLWIQANNFHDPDSSFSFSVAKIPWRGKFFTGFISFLYYNNKYHMFSTYNNSIIQEINHSDQSIFMVLKNKKNTLKVSSINSLSGELKAPVSGSMSRRIKESVDSKVSLALYDSNNEIIYTDSSPRAGVEVIEKIFGYLRE